MRLVFVRRGLASAIIIVLMACTAGGSLAGTQGVVVETIGDETLRVRVVATDDVVTVRTDRQTEYTKPARDLRELGLVPGDRVDVVLIGDSARSDGTWRVRAVLKPNDVR